MTKKNAEDLTNYLKEHNYKADYMHSDVDTIDRIKLIRSLRIGDIDIIIGINLLREGLDIPNVDWLQFWMQIKRLPKIENKFSSDNWSGSKKC